jgi:hypothetical protein
MYCCVCEAVMGPVGIPPNVVPAPVSCVPACPKVVPAPVSSVPAVPNCPRACVPNPPANVASCCAEVKNG